MTTSNILEHVEYSNLETFYSIASFFELYLLLRIHTYLRSTPCVCSTKPQNHILADVMLFNF